MTTQPFSLTINPQPASLALANNVTAQVFALHALTPLAKVVFAQDLTHPDDIHQFQVYTKDSRAWLDVVNGKVGGHFASPTPSLIRGTVSIGEWLFAEWNAIQQLRNAIYKLHVALHETSLIQYLFSQSDVILDASPSSASAGVGSLTVEWDAPGVGHLDWIGLFLVGDPNTSYRAFYTVPDNDADDTHSFATPATPGTYEFRYLVANGYTDIARSNPIVVS